MPDYAARQSDIERIVNAIIDIKRKWFSLDETNLEYHGLIAQMDLKDGIEAGLDKMQEQLTADYAQYTELVKETMTCGWIWQTSTEAANSDRP